MEDLFSGVLNSKTLGTQKEGYFPSLCSSFIAHSLHKLQYSGNVAWKKKKKKLIAQGARNWRKKLKPKTLG